MLQQSDRKECANKKEMAECAKQMMKYVGYGYRRGGGCWGLSKACGGRRVGRKH
jgi:hypothetical protein